jgi:spore coat polysaccharide biosynthesis protein SpsF
MKIGALTPIRLASERLPGKALMEICGRPVVFHLLDRMVASRHIGAPEDVVVCTTEESSDDALEDAVRRYGCSVFRGNTGDIIRRFGDAMAAFGFDAVIQADGDDPLSSLEYMDLTMEHLLSDTTLDIVTSEGLPLGCNVKSFSRVAMEKVLAAYRTDKNDTGFADFFTKTGLCKHSVIQASESEYIHDSARLTLDYEVDFELFRRIFEALYVDGELFGLEAVTDVLNRHPDWIEINRSVGEEYWQRHGEKSVLQFEDIDGAIKHIGS